MSQTGGKLRLSYKIMKKGRGRRRVERKCDRKINKVRRNRLIKKKEIRKEKDKELEKLEDKENMKKYCTVWCDVIQNTNTSGVGLLFSCVKRQPIRKIN
jgi:hypothetical protein